MRTKTWRCPGCDACTVRDDPPGVCSVCQKHDMELWNISDDVQKIPMITVGRPDVPVGLWLEDRTESKCLLCDRPLRKLLPQGFVGYVIKNGPGPNGMPYTFPIGAACERCARQHGKDLKLAPVLELSLPAVSVAPGLPSLEAVNEVEVSRYGTSRPLVEAP